MRVQESAHAGHSRNSTLLSHMLSYQEEKEEEEERTVVVVVVVAVVSSHHFFLRLLPAALPWGMIIWQHGIKIGLFFLADHPVKARAFFHPINLFN
jgi:hypothetical protein